MKKYTLVVGLGILLWVTPVYADTSIQEQYKQALMQVITLLQRQVADLTAKLLLVTEEKLQLAQVIQTYPTPYTTPYQTPYSAVYPTPYETPYTTPYPTPAVAPVPVPVPDPELQIMCEGVITDSYPPITSPTTVEVPGKAFVTWTTHVSGGNGIYKYMWQGEPQVISCGNITGLSGVGIVGTIWTIRDFSCFNDVSTLKKVYPLYTKTTPVSAGVFVVSNNKYKNAQCEVDLRKL